MREELQKREGTSGTYFATFGDQYRTKWFTDYTGKERQAKMALFLNIRDTTGKVLTDHLWMYSKTFEHLLLSRGDVVRFIATSSPYRKGVRVDGEWLGVETDYKLTRPRDIVKVDKETLRDEKTQTGLEMFA